MKKKEKSIDELFREKLLGHELKPSAQALDKFNARLGNEQPRKGGLIWWWIVPLVAAGLTGWLWLSPAAVPTLPLPTSPDTTEVAKKKKAVKPELKSKDKQTNQTEEKERGDNAGKTASKPEPVEKPPVADKKADLPPVKDEAIKSANVPEQVTKTEEVAQPKTETEKLDTTVPNPENTKEKMPEKREIIIRITEMPEAEAEAPERKKGGGVRILGIDLQHDSNDDDSNVEVKFLGIKKQNLFKKKGPKTKK